MKIIILCLMVLFTTTFGNLKLTKEDGEKIVRTFEQNFKVKK